VRDFVEDTNEKIQQLTPPGQAARIFEVNPPVALTVIAGVHWLLIGLCLAFAFRH
jgi:hypothetical protein